MSPSVRHALLWVYAIQAVFASAILLGEIYRQESSFWIWEAFTRELTAHRSLPSAFLAGYVYLLFYSTFFTVPFAILGEVTHWHPRAAGSILIASAWSLCTCLAFGQALLAFARNVSVWLLIPWCLFSPFLLRVCYRHIKSNSTED